ncbi:hypothetical protein TcCL_ESM06677 [Trypanosoma cruzi]|nr:hypothetical protein TcCL_ESM06677 [Trypanosoma cruzi]
MITQEERGKTQAEPLEMKRAGAAPQWKQHEVQEGIPSKTKGALRVSGTWNGVRDSESGRHYYVNTEAKQRTWKIRKGPCKRVIGGMLAYEANGASCGLR